MGLNKKRLDIEEEPQEENIYDNFVKKEEVNNNQTDQVEENNSEVSPMNDVYEDQPYEYKEKEYKSGTLAENTKVTNTSKLSRGILFGFYLMLIGLGVLAFFLIRANKYEFYLKQDSVLIDSGSTYQVELIPKDPRYFDYTNYKYSMADESIATVDEFGTVTAVGKGQTTLSISLKPGLTSKKMKIITEDIEVTSVEIEVYKGDSYKPADNVSMNVNQSITIKPIVNSRSDLNVSGKYSSSNEDVAIVDSFGNVTAKKEGTAIITSEVNGVEGTITIEVKKDDSRVEPTPTVKPTTKPSTNPTVAPTEKPTTKPTVAPTEKPTAKPTVKPVIENIHMSSSNVSIKNGSTVQLTAIITPQELSSSKLTWASSNTKVATVSSTGLVKGVGTGTAKITAKTTNGLVASCEVKVTTDEVKVTGITLNKTTLSIKTQDQYQLVATVNPSNATVRKLIWTSDKESVATVNQSGLVTGKGEGNATIMVTSSDGRAVAKCVVTVKKPATPTPTVKPTTKPTATPTTKPTATPKVTAVSLGIASQTTKYVGEQLQLSATVTPSSVKNYTVKWSSDKTSVATVTQSGLVKFVGTGTVTITAEVNGVKGTATILVKTKPTATTTPTQKPAATPPAGTAFKSSQIKLSKTSTTITKGKTDTFTITVTKAAGTVKVTSSNTNVLKVSLPKGDDDMPICNQSTNLCFLDGFTSSDTITVTVTGVGAGTAYVNVEIGDVETSSGEVLSGTGKVGVLVK